MAINWTATSLMLGAVGLAAGIGAGMGIQSSRDAVEPWDDGLVQLSCFKDGKDDTHVVRGVGFSDIDAINGPHVVVIMPFDPKAGKSPDDQEFDANHKQYPLGCFVQGVKQKDIVRRSWR